MNDFSSKVFSRRDLLLGASKVSAAGGLTMISGGALGFLAGCSGSEAETGIGTAKDHSQLPWPYVKLDAADISKVKETAHMNWFKGFCAFATLSSIVMRLREKVGEPYTGFPIEALVYAHGGTAGWGGTCGTLVGAGLAASLAAGPQEGEAIVNEVMKWYSETELPIYKPAQPKAQISAVSRSGSILCHLSVGKWMQKQGVGFLSKEQMERCGRLAADVASKTAEYLNEFAENTFAAATKSPAAAKGMPSQTNCNDCHGGSVPLVNPPGGGESLIEPH